MASGGKCFLSVNDHVLGWLAVHEWNIGELSCPLPDEVVDPVSLPEGSPGTYLQIAGTNRRILLALPDSDVRVSPIYPA